MRSGANLILSPGLTAVSIAGSAAELLERTVLDGDLSGRLIDLDDLPVGQRRLRTNGRRAYQQAERQQDCTEPRAAACE